jgi:ribonuclease VapC
MIVDSSAMLAIVLGEPDGHRFDVAILKSAAGRMAAPGLLETSMILQARKGAEGVRDLDLILYKFKMEIVPFTETHARLARIAFERYGKGRHPAQLNFGDCMAYAVAREMGEELLFKGTDFSQTDIAAAL